MRLLTLVVACCVVSPAMGAEPYVAEFMAANETGITDEDGSRSDWIELCNPGPDAVALEGWGLSDDPGDPGRWTFPAVGMPAGSSLLVWASGKDRRNPAAPLHTNFSLKKGGEGIILSRPDGTVADDRFAGFPEQHDDTSYGVSSTDETVVLLETGAPADHVVPTAEVSGWREVDFTPAGWASGPQGLGYGSAFAGWIGTNVQAAMRNVNSTIYIRLPFTAADAAGITSLTLQTEYDDGFVVHLNGTQVDAAMAPANPGWNSTATASWSPPAGTPPRAQTVYPAAGLLREGANVVAVHGLNNFSGSSDFIARVRLTGARPGGGVAGVGFFAAPTPGGANGGSDTLVLPQAVTFQPPSGTFAANFSLVMQGAASGQVIRYTTDGSVPTAASALAGSTVAITNSATIRARVFTADGSQAGRVATAQYVKLDSYAQAFTSDMPLLVLDSRGQSMDDTTLKDVHFHLFDTDAGGVARLAAAPALSSRSGVRIRGSSSAGYPKKPYRVELRDEQGVDARHPLLGMGAEADWVLLAPYDFDRSYCHDVLVNELSRRMGQWSPRSRFVEVFFNQDGDSVESADYIGVYVLMERIEPGADRLDIEVMEPADLQPPDITGGYVFKVDRVDAGEYSWLTSRGIPNNTPGYSRLQWFVHVSPETEESLPAQRAWLEAEVQALEDALYTGDMAAFHARADAAAWIDHHILNVLAKNADSLRLSGYWHKGRLGKVKAGPLWDFDRSLESTDWRDDAPTGWHPTGDGTPYFGYDWWKQWFENHPDARQLWVDRWQELRLPGGVLATAPVDQLLDGLRAEIGTAAPVRNLSRWPSVPPRADYDGSGVVNHADEVHHIKDWLSQRSAWIDGQFVARPQFSRASAVVPAGTTVTLGGPGGATVYYTTDGSDPRAPGGGVAAGALPASGPLVITADVKLTARCRNPSWAGRLGVNAGNTVPWSSAAAEVFLVTSEFASAANLAVSEVHYHPLEPSEEELNPMPHATSGDFEFIELCNVGAQPVSLAGAAFDEGAPGAALVLDHHVIAAGDCALVVRDRQAFELRHGAQWSGRVAGVFPAGNLANDGESVTLRARDGAVIAAVAYDDGGEWPGRADGHGSSLEFTGAARGAADYAAPSNWRPSSEVEGSPGRAGLGPDGRVVVNEVLTRSEPPFVDAIELANRTAEAVDLSGWWLSDRGDPGSADDLRLFRIPDGTVLAAGAHIVFDERDFRPNGSWNPAAGDPSPNEFGLDGVYGDDVWLLEADPASGRLERFADHAEFGAALAGVSLGRFPDGDGEFMPLAVQTLADPAATTTPAGKLPGANSAPRVGPVVIHELFYQPAAADNPAWEFVELQNTGGATEALDRWRLRGAADFDFGPAHSLAPGATMVLVGFDPANPTAAAAFRARFGLAADVPLIGPWAAGNVLPDAGGLVRLWRADASPADDPTHVPRMVEDQANYSPLPPWPDAAGNGASLWRLRPAAWGDDPASWRADAATPGDALSRYASWAAFRLAGSPSNSPGDDPDGDGLVNLVEYALGGDPLVADALRPVRVDDGGGDYVFSWRRRLDRGDLVVVPEHGTDLVWWEDATGFDVVTGVDGVDEHHETVLPDDVARRFLRLRFILTP